MLPNDVVLKSGYGTWEEIVETFLAGVTVREPGVTTAANGIVLSIHVSDLLGNMLGPLLPRNESH